MKDIGEVLKNARENKEYTQKRVMELTGINKKSLSGYENNVAEPDLATFSKLAQLYGLSADEVLEIKPCLTAAIPLSNLDMKLLATLETLGENRKKEVLVQLEALVRYINQNEK